MLVSGTATAGLDGECVRCLEPIHDEIEVGLQELYVYDDKDHDPDEDDGSARCRETWSTWSRC